MPSLNQMKSLDPAGDSFQPLGPPVRETPVDPKPLPKPTGTPGVVQLPDGKLATNLPLPSSNSAIKVHDSTLHFGLSAEEFQKAFLADLSEIELRFVSWGTLPKFEGSKLGGTSTGRFRSDKANFSNELKGMQALTPAEETLERALLIAVKQKDYPVSGTAWSPFIPGSIAPNGATWVVLRCGEVRPAHGIDSWGSSSQNNHHPDYDVVGWK